MRRTFLFYFVFSVVCFAGISVDWTLPFPTDTAFVIPYSSITVDGVLTEDEWANSLCFPVRSKFHIATAKRQWAGPMDAGMEFYAAWNEKGLFFGAIVADNEVINDAPVEATYQQDCIEIFIDGREKNRFMKPPYSKGCYQILVKPPSGENKPIATTYGANKIKDMQVEGKRTKQGYVIELFVPWSAFPDISQPYTGRDIAIGVMLDDYDKKDTGLSQPLSLSYFGKKDLYKNPQNFIRLVCGEKKDQFFSIECPSITFEKTLSVSVETGSMTGKISSLKIRIEDKDGKIIKEKTPKLTQYAPPWTNAIKAETFFDGEKISEDFFFVCVVTEGKKEKLISKKPVVFLGNVLAEILSSISKADIKKLSQTDPFRATGFLAVGACYEKIKRTVETDDKDRLVASVRETAARLDILNRKKLKETSSLIDFLVLTQEPEAQVVVEYPAMDLASITFYWGSFPLANVRVKKFPDENMAKEAARQKMEGFIDLLEDANPAGPVVIAGLPARASSWAYMVFYFNILNFDAKKQLMVVLPPKKQIYVIDSHRIDYVDTESVVIPDDADEELKRIVQKYASSDKTKRKMLAFENAMKTNSVLLVAGKVPEPLLNFRAYRLDIVKQSIIRVPYRDMLVYSSHPSRWVAGEAIKLVLRRKSISEQEVEKIRKTLVNEFAFSTKSSESVKSQFKVFVGDLHAHSNFSDGYLSPVGLTLQSMYCFMDFFALTDHNTIEGAKIVSNLLSKYGFDYTFIVGEEITTKNFHFNAYPLKKLIPWDVSDQEIINLAKQQDAVIHWNHPGWTNSQWELVRIDQVPAEGTLDAWEHIPAHYYKWKKQGILPALVGTTDTHDGTFSNPERTAIVSADLSEKSIVDAIKNKKSILISPYAGSDFMYGENDAISEAWDFLLEAKEIKTAKKDYIKNLLKEADLLGLLGEKYQKFQTGK